MKDLIKLCQQAYDQNLSITVEERTTMAGQTHQTKHVYRQASVTDVFKCFFHNNDVQAFIDESTEPYTNTHVEKLMPLLACVSWETSLMLRINYALNGRLYSSRGPVCVKDLHPTQEMSTIWNKICLGRDQYVSSTSYTNIFMEMNCMLKGDLDFMSSSEIRTRTLFQISKLPGLFIQHVAEHVYFNKIVCGRTNNVLTLNELFELI